MAYEGGTIIAQGDATHPVLFTSSLGRLQASEVRLDTIAQTLNATGEVRLDRDITTSRLALRPRSLPKLFEAGRMTETATGQNLTFNFKTQTGALDRGSLRTDQADFRADRLEINGLQYTARRAVLRPGGLSDEELHIYGTPPLSVRAREIRIRRNQGRRGMSVSARGAGLYVGSTLLLPLPSTAFRIGGGGQQSDFNITPRAAYNSVDGLLVTTRIGVPLTSDPRDLTLLTDIGLSQHVGFRGGVSLLTTQSEGDVRLAFKSRDVVQTQLTSSLELDRKPELIYQSPAFATFALGGGKRVARAGFSVDAGYGRFTERERVSTGLPAISSDRTQARLVFSTRLTPQPGPFLRAFTATSHYSQTHRHYDTSGVEFGYGGRVFRRLSGEISLRLTRVSGQTPFRFDLIEIPRELRTTFDVELTPRYLLPFDIRYDLNQSKIRDATFGLLRSYKVFAYGVEYQTARRDLRLEIRAGF